MWGKLSCFVTKGFGSHHWTGDSFQDAYKLLILRVFKISLQNIVCKSKHILKDKIFKGSPEAVVSWSMSFVIFPPQADLLKKNDELEALREQHDLLKKMLYQQEQVRDQNYHNSSYWNWGFDSSTPGQNGCHFADDIFRCIFVTEKFCIFIKI